jgi:hypothetical protein
MSLMRFPENMALVLVRLSHRWHSLTCSTRTLQREGFRSFLMSEECFMLGQLVVNMA